MQLVDQVCADLEQAPVSAKLKALLRMAAKVQQGGKAVTAAAVAAAREAAASDVEIHDVVLIAAAFCMFNRYVDGLATIAPDDPAGYQQAAERIVTEGYLVRAAGEGLRARRKISDWPTFQLPPDTGPSELGQLCA